MSKLPADHQPERPDDATLRAQHEGPAQPTVRELAEEYGVSKDTMRNWLLAAGVTPRVGRGGSAPGVKHGPRRPVVRGILTRGKQWDQATIAIARELEMNLVVLRDALIRHGL